MKKLLVLALAAVGLTACMSQTDLSAVESEVAEFHQRQAQGDDASILEDASPGFRASASLEDLARLNAAVRAVAGCNSPTRNPNIWNNNINTSGHYITVVYNRTCTGGDLTENFNFLVNGAEAHLQGYNVSGMALFPASAAPAAVEPATTTDAAEPPVATSEPALESETPPN